MGEYIMFKANVKKLVVRTSVIMGLATTATIATSQTADANVDMNKVDAAEKKQAQTQTTSEQTESNTNQAAVTTVRYGDTNETVGKIQGQLGIPQDNIYGPQTEQSVRKFQENNNLQVDGIAGPATQKALNAGGQATASTSNVSTNTTTNNSTATTNTESSSSNSTSTASTPEVNEEVSTEVAGETVSNKAPASSGGLVQTALNQTGAPYAWGGTSPSGFDCSGFINYVFNSQGKSIPRTAQAMYDASSKGSPSVGDIVFFSGTYDSGSYISHAGIYIGNNEFVHAGSRGVETASLNNSYWSQHYVGAGSL